MLLLYLLFILLPAACVANTYNPYQYDLTTPQFTPDGRLLQVEYAAKSVSEKSVILVLPLNNSTTTLLISHHPTEGMERFIVFENVIIGLAGIVADNLYLLRKIRQENLQQRRLFHAPLSTKQIADVVARECQQRAFGGGLRPFGATLLICGPQNEIYRTDPSGAFTAIDETFVLGGTSSLQRKLKNISKGDSIMQTIRKVRKVLQGTPGGYTEVAVVSDRGVFKLSEEEIDKE